MREHFRPTGNPVADPACVLTGDGYRICVLADGLVRLEYSASGEFEDRASQAVVDRAFPPAEFDVVETDDRLTIHTARLQLVYDKRPFSTEGLSVQAKGGLHSERSVWRFGLPTANLGGTARTLDEADGAVPLEPGVLSRDGVTCYDDSATVLLTDDGWIAPRRPDTVDLYVFAYGRDYRAALRALYHLTGPQPLLPRFALGNWWSRYHPYSADEYLGLMDRFAAEGIPLSVAVLDMDWHLVDIDPRHGSGWTGYTWNRDLFPDPPAFLAALHDRGLATTLNVHPAEGVHAHEERYAAIARRMGVDPDSELPVDFDPADPAFLEAYLEELHHPREAEGVDFWWLDWQQGGVTRIPGLDPLWLLNHYHFLDSGRDGKRPLTFSRYAGVGSHRYPIGFSGDTVITWASLDFQPYFTATASNVGYGWWSHDVGGHFFGYKDDELAVRWTQFGVFSPITRLHSSDSPFNTASRGASASAPQRIMTALPAAAPPAGALPAHDEPPRAPRRRAARAADVLRPPGRATRTRAETSTASATGCSSPRSPRPPTGRPAWARSRLAAAGPLDRRVHRPPVYRGGTTILLHRDLDTIPVLAPAGAILPLASGDLGIANPDALELRVYAGAEGEFTLAEERDDERWASPGSRCAARSCASTPSTASGRRCRRPVATTWCCAGSPTSPPSRSTGPSSRGS